MAGKVARPPLTRAEAVYEAEQSGRELTVYIFRNKCHLIPTRMATHIPIDAVIIHRTKIERMKKFVYRTGGNYVREETVDSRGVIRSIRTFNKPKNSMVERKRKT